MMIDSIPLEEDEIGNPIEGFDGTPFIDTKKLNECSSLNPVCIAQAVYRRVSDGKEAHILLWIQGRATGEVRWSPCVRSDIKDMIQMEEPTCITSGPVRGVWVFFEEVTREDFEMLCEAMEEELQFHLEL